MKIIDFPKNLTFHVRSNESEFYKELKRILALSRVTYFDPCCSTEETIVPVRYNSTDLAIEYYDIATDTWLDVAGSIIPTTDLGVFTNTGSGIVAFAGGGQASATALSSTYNRVTTAANPGDSVRLPAAVAGKIVYIRNDGASPIDVFPFLADSINDLAINLAVRVAPKSTTYFNAIDTTVWKSSNQVLSTDNITESTSGAGITLSKPIIRQPGTAKAVNVTGAITATELAGGLVTSTSAATVTATLPTAALFATQLGAVRGTQFEFIVDNSAGANTVTVAVNTGITVGTTALTGGDSLTISTAQVVGVFRLIFTSTTTAIIRRIA